MTKREHLLIWRAKNAEHVREYAKRYRAANVRARSCSYKAWSLKNREVLLAKKRAYAKARRDAGHKPKPKTQDQHQRMLASYRRYSKERRLRDLNFRLIQNLRSRTSAFVRGRNKSAATRELIGVSLAGLVAHLEQQFTDSMNWENYGTLWEIDHIRPCSTFDLSKPENQMECFNYKNLRPLHCSINRRLGQQIQHKWTGSKS